MKRLQIVVPVSARPAVEAALTALTGEPWALLAGPGRTPAGDPLPSPYPGAAWGSGQWPDDQADKIAAEVMRVCPAATVGRGATVGAEDTGAELEPYQVPTLEQALAPRECLASVYSRGRVALEAANAASVQVAPSGVTVSLKI